MREAEEVSALRVGRPDSQLGNEIHLYGTESPGPWAAGVHQ